MQAAAGPTGRVVAARRPAPMVGPRAGPSGGRLAACSRAVPRPGSSRRRRACAFRLVHRSSRGAPRAGNCGVRRHESASPSGVVPPRGGRDAGPAPEAGLPAGPRPRAMHPGTRWGRGRSWRRDRRPWGDADGGRRGFRPTRPGRGRRGVLPRTRLAVKAGVAAVRRRSRADRVAARPRRTCRRRDTATGRLGHRQSGPAGELDRQLLHRLRRPGDARSAPASDIPGVSPDPACPTPTRPPSRPPGDLAELHDRERLGDPRRAAATSRGPWLADAVAASASTPAPTLRACRTPEDAGGVPALRRGGVGRCLAVAGGDDRRRHPMAPGRRGVDHPTPGGRLSLIAHRDGRPRASRRGLRECRWGGVGGGRGGSGGWGGAASQQVVAHGPPPGGSARSRRGRTLVAFRAARRPSDPGHRGPSGIGGYPTRVARPCRGGVSRSRRPLQRSRRWAR